MGDRLRQTVGGVTTNYALDLNTGLTQVLADGTNTYLYGNGRIAQYETVMQYFGADGLGSVRQIYNATGIVRRNTLYDPFGNVLTTNGTAASGYGYTGEQTDATGLVFLRARYYAPNLGRFTTRDTWDGDEQRPLSLNRWNYVEANPVTFADPSGRWRWRNAPDRFAPHALIEDYYELFPFNPDRQIEYTIIGTGKYADMFDSTTGDLFEIEPVNWVKKLGHGAEQAQSYVDRLNTWAEKGRLTGMLKGSQIEYDWNALAGKFHLGFISNWPGKKRFPYLADPNYEVVADFYADGLIVFWLEPKEGIKDPVPLPKIYGDAVRQRDWTVEKEKLRKGGLAPQPVPVPAYEEYPEALGTALGVFALYSACRWISGGRGGGYFVNPRVMNGLFDFGSP